MTTATASETVALEAFLGSLPADAAAAARAAAARIDALERSVPPPNWIERNLARLAAGALALFLLGIVAMTGIVPGLGLGGAVLLSATVPALVFAYAWSVRGRTAIDRAKMALNAAHFLPHGGLYFGSRAGPGNVVRFPVDAAGPNLRERTEALYRRTTARRWWW